MKVDPAWSEWRQACAFSLLNEESRGRLHIVVAHRFRSRIRLLNAKGAGIPQLDDAECAHLFESWCALHQRRDGKRYKDWLLTRGDQDQDAVESGVLLLVRNVVREWVRTQHHSVAEVSLDAPIREASGLSLRELLPSHASERSEEQQGWMSSQIPHLLSGMKDVENAACWVRARGWVYSHPQARESTGFAKTALHQAHRGLLTRVAEQVKDAFPGLGAEEGARLVLDVMDRVGEHLLQEFPGKGPNLKLQGAG